MVVLVDIFAPSRLVFQVGVAYRLHIENQGDYLHKFTNFASPAFFHAVDVHTPAVLNADRSETDVPAGEMRDLLFVAEEPGSFELRCPDHALDGMTGNIAITP